MPSRRFARPPARWFLLGFLLVAMAVLLGVQGLSTRTTGPSRTPAVDRAGPLAGERPLLGFVDGRLRSREEAPGRRIALTFDDGPDPRWTPRIAATLRSLHVPATFFVVGSQVVRHPDVVRDLHRQGFELGNHTFTHAELSKLPGWERSFQISLTENAIAGVVGVRPRLIRPPYSSVPAALTPAQAKALAGLAKQGYLIALSDFDGEDWRRSGAAQIVRAATPTSSRGGIILLHDGGGDRSQTVAALEQLVPALQARGFRFVRVSELAGLTPQAAELPVGGWERVRGRALVSTLAVARWTTWVLSLFLVLVSILFVVRIVVLLGFARRHARRYRAREETSFEPPVSIVVPAFDEAVGIERAVRSLAESDYPELEVIVVDDGSSDGTASLVEALGLPHVQVLQQENAGKPAALNHGISVASHDVIVMVDADTVFEPETLGRLVRELHDPDVGAVSGNTKVGNRKGLLGRWQHIEYVMGFNLDRRLYDVLQCMPTVPGAIGAFRREALADVGGVSGETLAEDTDLTIAIGRAGWRVVYSEDARAWTEAPATLGQLWRQRYRWSYGTLQAVWKHKAALWRRGEDRRLGRRGLPYLILFQIALPLFAPLVDVFSVYGFVFLDSLAIIGFWLVFTSLQVFLGWYAFLLDRESPRVLWAMPLQQFVYRQLMYLVVVESVLSALRGARLRWRPIARSGAIEVAK
jgi:cellulose synthase/poly-beta-1,6-N-acetylglucosamine synthase-like glycosyltransferase/peptidoglycan/xylan/chitin deacetylase (PgdA/CDA1 family)